MYRSLTERCKTTNMVEILSAVYFYLKLRMRKRGLDDGISPSSKFLLAVEVHIPSSLPFKNRLYVTPIVCRNNVQLSLAESDFAEYQLTKSSALAVICHSQGVSCSLTLTFPLSMSPTSETGISFCKFWKLMLGGTLVTVASYEENIPFIF